MVYRGPRSQSGSVSILLLLIVAVVIIYLAAQQFQRIVARDSVNEWGEEGDGTQNSGIIAPIDRALDARDALEARDRSLLDGTYE